MPKPDKPVIPILAFADSILGLRPYDWQCRILLNYEAKNQTAAACANFTGKTSTVFPIAALWTLYNFPRSRIMYLSATGAQVEKQFFATIEQFQNRPAFSGWKWLLTDVKNSSGGFMFGRATDAGGHIEGLHDNPGSPASLLVDEAKSIDDKVLDTLERCHASFRLFMSSTGPASGGFYEIMTSKSHLWKTFTITTSMCPHVTRADIESARENMKPSVFAVAHDAKWLYDAGDSMISLDYVRALVARPPARIPGRTTAFCDFAGPGDKSAIATCEGNFARFPEEPWSHRDTMHSVGKFLTIFRRLRLASHQIGGDEGYGHQLMDRMAEEGFHLRRFNNGSPALRNDIYFNLAAEWWSIVGQLIERRQIIIPNDERLIAQLTSRQKLYDSKGRERLESKADMKSRGLPSPDMADSLIGAIMMGMGSDPFALSPGVKNQMQRDLAAVTEYQEKHRNMFATPFIDFNRWW